MFHHTEENENEEKECEQLLNAAPSPGTTGPQGTLGTTHCN